MWASPQSGLMLLLTCSYGIFSVANCICFDRRSMSIEIVNKSFLLVSKVKVFRPRSEPASARFNWSGHWTKKKYKLKFFKFNHAELLKFSVGTPGRIGLSGCYFLYQAESPS